MIQENVLIEPPTSALPPRPATAQESVQATHDERRRKPRTPLYCTDKLTITSPATTLSVLARDFSRGGMAVDAPQALKEGSTVWLAGPLEIDGYRLEVSGQARVAHCRPSPDGLFRVGLAFQNVHYRAVD